MNQNSQNQKLPRKIAEAQLQKQYTSGKQKEIAFYSNKQKIAVLNYKVEKQSSHKQTNKKVGESSNFREPQYQTIPKTKMKPKFTKEQSEEDEDSDNSQNQRYHVNFTPHDTCNNSMIKLVPHLEHSHIHTFKGLDESSILERQPFSLDQSLQINEEIQSGKRKQAISQNKPLVLQKWLKKLQKFQEQKQKQSESAPLYECRIPEKYLNKNSSDKTTLSLINLTLNSSLSGESYSVKTLKLKVIDDYGNNSIEPVFQCSFFLLNSSNKEDLSMREMRFKNLITEIPQDKNVQIQFCLENLDQSEEDTQVTGILMKDKLTQLNQIPLFGIDQQVFASLGYNAKKIQNASVQCLPSLEQIQVHTPQNVQSWHQNSFGSKNKIKQRKFNINLRREIMTDLDHKKSFFDNKQSKPTAINSGVRSTIRRETDDEDNSDQNLQNQVSVNRKDSFFSSNLIERSNTDETTYNQQENELEQRRSNSPQSIRKLRSKIIKMSESSFGYLGNVSLPLSPTKGQFKHRLRLKSTDLADLRQEESDDQDNHSKYVKNRDESSSFVGLSPKNVSKKGMKLNKISTQPDQAKQHSAKDGLMMTKVLTDFIIELNGITVILYENNKPEEQQSGKFLILKSEEGETFITETLFTNHLNLNWKNKFYKFTSSKIQISLYERTGHSSQCQNKYIGKVIVRLVDLMKSIKQNFFRSEIFLKDKPIGIAILIYDIFMGKTENNFLLNRQKANASQMKIKMTSPLGQKETIQTEYTKHSLLRESQKQTIKTSSKLKNRKRAKTLQTGNRSNFLPSINTSSSPSRKRSYYQGGKNITIGRAERFSNMNMAEIVGQL